MVAWFESSPGSHLPFSYMSSDVRERPSEHQISLEKQRFLDSLSVRVVRPCPITATFLLASLLASGSSRRERAMLTDTECRNLKPRAKPLKKSDGGGLYLLVKTQ
jgi:hypothetical protein